MAVVWWMLLTVAVVVLPRLQIDYLLCIVTPAAEFPIVVVLDVVVVVVVAVEYSTDIETTFLRNCSKLAAVVVAAFLVVAALTMAVQNRNSLVLDY